MPSTLCSKSTERPTTVIQRHKDHITGCSNATTASLIFVAKSDKTSSEIPACRFTRKREVPSGTVGGRIAPTRNPWLSSRSATAVAALGSRKTIGTIGPTDPWAGEIPKLTS